MGWRALTGHHSLVSRSRGRRLRRDRDAGRGERSSGDAFWPRWLQQSLVGGGVGTLTDTHLTLRLLLWELNRPSFSITSSNLLPRHTHTRTHTVRAKDQAHICTKTQEFAHFKGAEVRHRSIWKNQDNPQCRHKHKCIKKNVKFYSV